MGMIESSAHLLKEFWLWIVIIAVLIGLVSCTMNSFNFMKITLINKKNVTENVTENITEENETEEETNETTGEVVKLEESNSLLENNSFLILLEVTLVLILFVLLMILFRLKPARSEKTE